MLARWALFVALALLIGPLVVRLLVVRGPVPARVERGFHLLGVVAAFLVIDVGIVAFVLRASNAVAAPARRPLVRRPAAVRREDALRHRVPRDDARLRESWQRCSCSPGSSTGRSCAGPPSFCPWRSRRVCRCRATRRRRHNAGGLSQAADWLHLVAASVWAGGLVAARVPRVAARAVSPARRFPRFRPSRGSARRSDGSGRGVSGARPAPRGERPLADAVRPLPPAETRHRHGRPHVGRGAPLSRASASRGWSSSPTCGRASWARRPSRSRCCSPRRS